MAKYRGKQEGRTRGKYVRAKFTCSFENEAEWSKACDKTVELGMAHAGEHVLCTSSPYRTKGLLYDDSYYDSYYAAFHLAGATVGVKGISYYNFPRDSIGPHKIDLEIVSNDAIEDVIEKIRSILPYQLEYIK
jgi:hypothetical protein